MNKSLVLATLVAAFALTACGKKEEAAAPVAEAASAVVAPAPAPEAAPAVVAPAVEAASASVDAASAAAK
jgi:hypothetical protein